MQFHPATFGRSGSKWLWDGRADKFADDIGGVFGADDGSQLPASGMETQLRADPDRPTLMLCSLRRDSVPSGPVSFPVLDMSGVRNRCTADGCEIAGTDLQVGQEDDSLTEPLKSQD